MPREGFETTILVFEQEKKIPALHLVVTVISNVKLN
jgi:hypothetical protein